MIYKRNKRKSVETEQSEVKKSCQAALNIFMPTRDENNLSPTIQILAQSIISVEEEANQSENVLEKPVTVSIVERLSERFKRLQNKTDCRKNESTLETQSNIKDVENASQQSLNNTVLELEKESEKYNIIQTPTQTQIIIDHKESTSNQPTDTITVISDDENWEDIEITETAPTISSTNPGNTQKSKNKGLFQKFGIFKGNSTKSKKHLPPIVFLPKKKLKDKSLQCTTLSPIPSIKGNTLFTVKQNTQITNASAHLGSKPVINIMDDLLPDSPCNDPIDLVPELAPLEPLQDLNDISSILDSNLSAMETSVSIHVNDHHTSIEDALDFISEQQANDKQKTVNSSMQSITQSQGKTIINNISHVGYSIQATGENNLKFYCLLQNCSFLYSSDSVGLETHFMCEHSQIKWNGYCLMCQSHCFPNANSMEEYSIAKEIRHMLEEHTNKTQLELSSTTESDQPSEISSHESEEKPKIKLRRMTGDCLSKANSENVTKPDLEEVVMSKTNAPTAMSMLGALLIAKPKPPTKEMPPQPQMPLTEPLLLDSSNIRSAGSTISTFRNVGNDFLITSVTSTATATKESLLQASSVLSVNKPSTAITKELSQLPKILNVRTLATEGGDSLWSNHVQEDNQELTESIAESLEVSQILASEANCSSATELPRIMNDSPEPVVVAETVPLAQTKTGDFVITQTVSAKYDEFASTDLGFNISIAAMPENKSSQESLPVDLVAPITSRQYKCMASGCKFVTRVPVAMSDHLRFHERRNLSNKREYFACGFCFYCASNVEDYMNHADQYHIVNKAGTTSALSTDSDIASTPSLTKKIHDILNSNNNIAGQSKNVENQLQKQTIPVQDTQETYLQKLRNTIDEIVGPTGLPDNKLYCCVIKSCHTQLSEATFINHVMYHVGTLGVNPNNYVFKCPHCTAQYHRVAGIKAHIKNHGRNRFFCYLCEQTSTNPGQILKHFSDKHWHTLNMYTKELLMPKISTDGSGTVVDSSYYVAYTQELNDEEVKQFGEKLILDWQRKKSGSKTHFKSSEIDLLPLSAIFLREVNCGECEYKTKVRTNMYRHLQMHKQNPGLANNSGVPKVYSVDPVNPVPCLNSTERFFDKMTNLASSSLIPSSSSLISSSSTSIVGKSSKSAFKIPYAFVPETKRFTCGCQGCNYLTISEDIFRSHLSTLHSTAITYRCTFCQEDICKRGISIDRIINHLRFHRAIIYRCEQCNYLHHMRYVVERHINERHATLKVNIVTHKRLTEENLEGTTSTVQYTGKKYKEALDSNQNAQISSSLTTSGSSDSSNIKSLLSSSSTSGKSKGGWVCDVCGHKSSTASQIQTHCQQHHGVKNQYKCAHCNFGSQQLSQILFHIDEKHPGKTREACYMYHKSTNGNDAVADTRPLWQRNDPTRVRHIRGILMEDEEESEEYIKKLGLTEDIDDDDIEDHTENLKITNDDFISGYEFGCFHCDFKTQTFDNLKMQHYKNVHNCQQELAKPFWYRLHRRLCCAECRSFIGISSELQQHLKHFHKKNKYYATDITMTGKVDSSQKLLCGYCSFQCTNIEQLHRHHLRVQHLPHDVRIDNNEQIMNILSLGKSENSYQCTLCADIFPNSIAVVQHACNAHGGEESFSFRELKNSLIYRCVMCTFTSTTEIDLLRHMIDHYTRFQICHFCHELQTSFNVYMQHCYAEHRNDIPKFKTIYPLSEIRKFLLQMFIVFPNGLVLSKRNLFNTKYGKTDAIEELYEDIYKISQQPPIPRLSIARLVARKSIEAQQKRRDSSSPQTFLAQSEQLVTEKMQTNNILKRRCTVAVSQNGDDTDIFKSELGKSELKPNSISKRRITVDYENATVQNIKFNEPLQPKNISKRRRTVAVDRETLFSTNLSSPNFLLNEKDASCKRQKILKTPSPHYTQEFCHNPLNLYKEPFSFYGTTPKPIDLSKIYTKVVIGGIKTPITIDKFKLLFNIECYLKLPKCDQKLDYNKYKHIKKACPASHKLKYN